MKKMTPDEFMNKCVWEGGDLLTGFEYGLNGNHLDDSNPEFKQLVIDAHAKFCEYKTFEKDFYDYCDKMGMDWEP